MPQKSYAIYLHIPFCKHRCAYCDFNTYAGIEDLVPAYVDALCEEIRSVGKSLDQRLPVGSIFFGGGTPSLLAVKDVEKILLTIVHDFHLQNKAEITLEANPGTISENYLRGLSKAGVNRLSIGMQSANTSDLSLLERQHSLNDIRMAVKASRNAGFENINLDLIFGIPYQSLNSWKGSLAMALSLQPDHFSLYALTLEKGTPMESWVKRGLISVPDPDLAADMYEFAGERLSNFGFDQYEISNWARKTENHRFQCQHNLRYWRFDPYLGFGAGAHGFARRIRTINVLTPQKYIRCMTGEYRKNNFPISPATDSFRKLSDVEEMGDYMMMGLRLVREGVSLADFYHRFGIELRTRYTDEIQMLKNAGLIEFHHDVLRLTKRGYLLGNQVFKAFL
jgi:oxygen-independent coproporphyrinogen-3 oxidase